MAKSKKKKKSAVSPDFEKALAARKQAVSRWKKAKEAKPSTGFLPDIDSGQYYARIQMEADKTEKDGTPRIRIRQTILTGEYKGKSWSNDFYLKDKSAEREQQTWDRLSRAIQVLADVEEDEFDDWQIADLISFIDELNKEAPVCKIGVSRKDGDDGRFFLNTYYNELVDEEDVPEDDEEEDEEEEEEDEEDEDEEDEDEEEEERPRRGRKGRGKRGKSSDEDEEDEEEEEDDEEEEEDEEEEDEEIEYAKGDYVWHKVKKGKKTVQVECKISSVNKRNKTANLAEVDGKGKWPGVKWADLEPSEDEEEEEDD